MLPANLHFSLTIGLSFDGWTLRFERKFYMLLAATIQEAMYVSIKEAASSATAGFLN